MLPMATLDRSFKLYCTVCKGYVPKVARRLVPPWVEKYSPNMSCLVLNILWCLHVQTTKAQMCQWPLKVMPDWHLHLSQSCC